MSSTYSNRTVRNRIDHLLRILLLILVAGFIFAFAMVSRAATPAPDAVAVLNRSDS